MERLVFFSDAVFAIAITLLVIDLPTPVLNALNADQSLLDALSALSGHLFAFFVGFLVIGSYWVGHLRVLNAVVRADLRLIWLNLGFLLWIVAVPFASGTLGANPLSRATVILFALVQVAAGLLQLTLWIYVNRHPELRSEPVPPTFVRNVMFQLAIAPAIFALSVPIAIVFGPTIGAWAWVTIAVAGPLVVLRYPIQHGS